MLRNFNQEKKQSINLGGYILLFATIYFIYYLLLDDNLLKLSITSISSWSNHFTRIGHILSAGLVPIFLSLTIFGASISSIYIGALLQRQITHFWNKYFS